MYKYISYNAGWRGNMGGASAGGRREVANDE
jgi:hypothetical protein